MNIGELHMSNALARSEEKPIAGSGRATSFQSILQDVIAEKSEGNRPASSKPSQSLRRMEEGLRTPDKEDRYCSLCGSLIDEEGRCPLCIIPFFIHGSEQSHNPTVSQADSSNAVSLGNPRARVQSVQIG